MVLGFVRIFDTNKKRGGPGTEVPSPPLSFPGQSSWSGRRRLEGFLRIGAFSPRPFCGVFSPLYVHYTWWACKIKRGWINSFCWGRSMSSRQYPTRLELGSERRDDSDGIREKAPSSSYYGLVRYAGVGDNGVNIASLGSLARLWLRQKRPVDTFCQCQSASSE